MYDEDYFRKREKSLELKVERGEIINLLKPQKSERILEIGCGAGYMLRQLEKYGCTPIGIDRSPEVVKMAKKNVLGSQVIRGIADKLSFREFSFNKIVCQHLIEHLDDVASALQAWRRVLKDDGCLVIATPNCDYPDPDIFYDPDHKHIFSLGELKKLLNDNGFIVTRALTLMPHIYFCLRGKKLRLGVRFWRICKFLGIHSQNGQSILVKARRGRNNSQ